MKRAAPGRSGSSVPRVGHPYPYTAAALVAALVAPLFLLALPAAHAASAIALSIERLSRPGVDIRKLRLRREPGAAAAQLHVDRLVIGNWRWAKLRLDCARFDLSSRQLSCRGGRLRAGREVLPAVLDLELDLGDGGGEVRLRMDDGGRIDARVDSHARLHGRVVALSLAPLARWFPELLAWRPTGVFSGDLDWQSADDAANRPARLRLSGALADGGFASADGRQAAEKLALDISIDATQGRRGWDWSGAVSWTAGAAYWHPFYVEAGPLLRASGSLEQERLVVREAAIELDGVGQLAATASIDLDTLRLTDAAMALSTADLAVIGPQFIAPLLAPASAERLRFAGSMSAGLRFEQGALTALDAVFDEAGFSLARAGGGGAQLSLGPVSGHLPWRLDGSVTASLRVDGGRWEKLSLGAFALEARVERDTIDLARSRIPVLDGAIVVDELMLRRGGGGWTGRGSATVEPISMPLLTDALGLPIMAGVLSASIPGLRVAPGEIALDGALVTSVFDGYLRATGLRLLEPFGVASHLSAELELRHIDLAQLTDTFSFGSITGFVDADVHGLELVRWRPVRFDARIGSSPGRYRKRISQRAVQNISALGGAGAVAALQRGLLGLFDTFGYSEIGLRCVLAKDVCVMSGIEGADRADGSFVIVKGGGLPALDVIGYNRRVDWKELVGRLQRVIEGNVAPVTR